MEIVPVPNRKTLEIQPGKPKRKLSKICKSSQPDLTKPNFDATMHRIKDQISATTENYRKRTEMGIVAVKELPKRKQAERKSKYPFTAKEVEQAVAQFKKDGRVGCGPYEAVGVPLRAARSAAQRLKNLVADAGNIDPANIGTTAWSDEQGEWGALVAKNAE